jgi:carbon-monoxide dehydrogenase medium subunit
VLAHPIRYVRPESLAELLDTLGEAVGGAGEGEARLLAGGMTLVPSMNLGLARPSVLISIRRIAELDGVGEEGEWLSLGATATHRRLAEDPRVRAEAPHLAAAAAALGDAQVRSRGTLGGSLAHADPQADYLPVLVASGARLRLASRRGRREVDLAAWLRGPFSVDLAADEVLIRVLVPKGIRKAAYYRYERIRGGFPEATAAAVVRGSSVRVAVGGVVTRPLVVELEGVPAPQDLAAAVEEGLTGATLNVARGDEAAYRRNLAVVAARRALERLPREV